MVTTKGNMAEFVFFRPQAKVVCIVGDFNGWRDDDLMMTPQPDGTWTARVWLPPGDFKFRYRADGEWFIDFAAFGIECGDFGLDSVVRIDARQVKPQPVLVARPQRPSKAHGPRLTPNRARTARLSRNAVA